MVIHESAEDYLESILVLQQRRGQVRSIDIVNELGYSKPSVSIAMKKLRENGYISMDADGSITLNESGMAIASRVYGRHKTLSKLFELLGVSPEVASEDACKVERRTAASGTIWTRWWRNRTRADSVSPRFLY